MENQMDVDVELQEAQRMLARAQQRKADALESARVAAAAALAKNLADEEERLLTAKRESEAIQKMWAEKKAAEEQARRTADAAKAAEMRRLEAEAEARAQAVRQEEERQARVRRVEEAAFVAEQEAKALEQELLRATTPKVESKPASLESMPSALASVFGLKSTEQVQIEEISSSQQEKIQAEADRASAIAEPVRKPKPTSDYSTSAELEKILRPALGQVNVQRCDRLASEFSPTPLLKAAQQIAAQCKTKPMGCDAAFYFLESLLETEAAL